MVGPKIGLCSFYYTYPIHLIKLNISYALHLMNLSLWLTQMYSQILVRLVIIISILGPSGVLSRYIAVHFCVWRIICLCNPWYPNCSVWLAHLFESEYATITHSCILWSSCCISWLVIYTSVLIETSLFTWPSLNLVILLNVFGVFAQDTWIRVDLKGSYYFW